MMLVKPLVLDVGSNSIRLGIAGEEEPRIILKNFVGVKKSAIQLRMVQGLIDEHGIELNKPAYFGLDALKRYIGLDIKNPFEGGKIHDEKNMKLILDHMLAYLNVTKPLGRHVIISHPTLATERYIMFFIEYFMDDWSAMGICLSPQPFLAFLANNQQITGLMVELGHSQIQIAAILKGHLIKDVDFSYGGNEVDDYFRQLISSKVSSNEPINNVAPAIFIEKMKRSLCEIYPQLNLLEIKDDLSKTEKMRKRFILPDNSEVILGAERFLTHEILFRPELIGKEKSIPDMIYDVVESCDHDVRAPMYKNIFLSGGLARIPGITERLIKELNFFVPPTIEPKITIVCEDPAIATWQGASKIAISDKFQDICLSQSRYFAQEVIDINSVVYPTFQKLQIMSPPVHSFLAKIPLIYRDRNAIMILKMVEKTNILKFNDLTQYFNKPLNEIISMFLKLLAEGLIHGEILEGKGEFHKYRGL